MSGTYLVNLDSLCLLSAAFVNGFEVKIDIVVSGIGFLVIAFGVLSSEVPSGE